MMHFGRGHLGMLVVIPTSSRRLTSTLQVVELCALTHPAPSSEVASKAGLQHRQQREVGGSPACPWPGGYVVHLTHRCCVRSPPDQPPSCSPAGLRA